VPKGASEPEERVGRAVRRREVEALVDNNGIRVGRPAADSESERHPSEVGDVPEELQARSCEEAGEVQPWDVQRQLQARVLGTARQRTATAQLGPGPKQPHVDRSFPGRPEVQAGVAVDELRVDDRSSVLQKPGEERNPKASGVKLETPALAGLGPRHR
jgi:hypothetical protein